MCRDKDNEIEGLQQYLPSLTDIAFSLIKSGITNAKISSDAFINSQKHNNKIRILRR
jgi:hypothetical protein